MQTLMNSVEVEVIREDGKTQTIVVKQIPLRKYDAAFKATDNEMALAAIACDTDAEWVLGLTPASYEKLQAAVMEVNAGGFFDYAKRRQSKLVESLNAIRPEMVRIVADAAAKTSSDSVLGLRPRRATPENKS